MQLSFVLRADGSASGTCHAAALVMVDGLMAVQDPDPLGGLLGVVDLAPLRVAGVSLGSAVPSRVPLNRGSAAFAYDLHGGRIQYLWSGCKIWSIAIS